MLVNDSGLNSQQRSEVERLMDDRRAEFLATDQSKERRTWYALVVVLVISLALNGVMYFVVVHTSRKICGIIVSLDEAYAHNPPTTPIGRDIADKMHRYREDLGCG